MDECKPIAESFKDLHQAYEHQQVRIAKLREALEEVAYRTDEPNTSSYCFRILREDT